MTSQATWEDVSSAATELVQKAIDLNVTLGTAESCTGGLISSALTSVPGSSAVVLGGVCSYAISVKEGVLKVPGSLIESKGVVSEDVARYMARGACHELGCDVAVSTTGIAGPGGAEPGKPVGTVCLGLALGSDIAFSKTIHAVGNRDQVRLKAVLEALRLLDEYID